jgi:predicted deacylase
VGPHDYRILITPENEPINPSPWYAFRLKASKPVEVTIRLAIATAKSRPRARISEDGIQWKRVADSDWKGDSGAAECLLKLKVGPKPVWVASNHMVSVDQLWAWTDALARKPGAAMRTIGQSIAGRPIKLVEVNQGAPANYVIVIGRQHPPEVTGSMGLMSFMDRIMDDSETSRNFRRKFRIVTVPLVNPDGVHEGQWRSTLGGVDANRDWHDFSQPETAAVRDAILEIQKRPDSRLFLLLDFHTTSKDIFYLPPDSAKTFPPSFSRRWVDAIQARFPDYEVESTGSHNVDQWTFKRWAFETTGAPGITYELGSGTSPARIERIVQGAADEAMKLLLESADAPRSEGPFPPKPGTIVEVKPSGRPAAVGP